MPLLMQLPERQHWIAAWTACCIASGAGAATVLESPDAVRLHGSGPATTASVLERALTIDTNTSQRNLDLLLDARRAGDVISPMRVAGTPGQPLALPALQPRGTLVPLGLQVQDSVTAPGVAERREWVGGAPAGTQSGLPGGRAGMGNADADTAGPRRAGQGADPGERLPIFQWMDEVRAFVRDNRVEVLAGVTVLLVGAAALQALARRR